MKVLQLNIWGGRMARGLARYLQEEQPDVICMQEVFNADFSVPFPDRIFDILARLKEASGLKYEYFSPRLTVDIAGKTAPYGNAILSRYPFTLTETIQTENTVVEHMTAENEVQNINNVQIVQFNDGYSNWTVANHHGHHEPSPDGNEDSVLAMQKVATAVKQYAETTPFLLCGDLNVQPTSPAMRVFDGWLNDAITTSGAITTLTGLNVTVDVVCDHILVNDKVEVSSIRVDPAIVSDHSPVVIEVEGK